LKNNPESIQLAEIEYKIGQPLISELEIQHRTAELARQISSKLKDENIVLIAVLKGAFMFAADLARRLMKQDVNLDLDFIRAKSYGTGTRSSGEVNIEIDVGIPLKGATVLLVDDIIDSGNTLYQVGNYLREKGAVEVTTCVLLDKPSRREIEFQPDFVGFEIPDKFVIGYGLDFAEKFRCLPYITHLIVDEQKSK